METMGNLQFYFDNEIEFISPKNENKLEEVKEIKIENEINLSSPYAFHNLFSSQQINEKSHTDIDKNKHNNYSEIEDKKQPGTTKLPEEDNAKIEVEKIKLSLLESIKKKSSEISNDAAHTHQPIWDLILHAERGDMSYKQTLVEIKSLSKIIPEKKNNL